MDCLSIHLTDLCNSECTFCVVASPLYAKDTVAYADVVRFLESHAGTSFTAVNLHGGEATIHPKFEETLALIRDLGYAEVHLQTNAIRLADEAFTGRLVEYGVTKFIISLHGSTAALHDSQTFTRGGFDKTIRGIRGAASRGAHVRINTVITKQNLEDLENIGRLVCDLGVSHVNYSNMHPVGSARFSRVRVMPDFNSMRPHLDAAIDAVLRRGVRLTLEGFPYCTVFGDGRERLHLNNEYRNIKLLIRGQILTNYDDFMRDDMRVFGRPCERCSVKALCGGVYPEYVDYFGWKEFRALQIDPATLAHDGAVA